jgi:hypothetical protein
MAKCIFHFHFHVFPSESCMNGKEKKGTRNVTTESPQAIFGVTLTLLGF